MFLAYNYVLYFNAVLIKALIDNPQQHRRNQMEIRYQAEFVIPILYLYYCLYLFGCVDI